MKAKTLILLLSFFCFFTLYQETASAVAQEPPPQGVRSNYDRFTDRTSVNVRILISSEPKIYLVLFNSGKGKQFVSRSVGVAFINVTDELWKYKQPAQTLYLLIDGERLEVPITRGPSGSGQGDLSIETLDKILAAKKLEGKIADLEFELSLTQMKLIREFRALLFTERSKPFPN